MPFFGRRVTKGSISIERSEARPRRNLGAIVASRSVASIIANPAPIAHAGPPQRANRQSGGGSHYESGSRSSGPGQIFPVHRAGSNGRCNTIWYKAVFKGGVYEARETVWAFRGAEDRCVASLEGRSDAA